MGRYLKHSSKVFPFPMLTDILSGGHGRWEEGYDGIQILERVEKSYDVQHALRRKGWVLCMEDHLRLGNRRIPAVY